MWLTVHLASGSLMAQHLLPKALRPRASLGMGLAPGFPASSYSTMLPIRRTTGRTS